MSKLNNNLIKVLKLCVEPKPGDLNVGPMQAKPDFTEHNLRRNCSKSPLLTSLLDDYRS